MTTTLTEHLDAATAPDNTDDGDNTTIGDDRHAEWVARKLRDLQLRRADIVAQADDHRRLIDEWEQSQTADLDSSIEFREGQLVRYLQQLRDNDDNVTSHKLPSATITSRAGRASVQVTDDDALREWAEQHPDVAVVSVKVSADKRALSKLPRTGDGQIVTDDGEPVPGVGVVEGERTYTVKVNR